MAMFKDCVCYQEEVRDPSRIPEVLNRVIEKAIQRSAPAQINIPRDMWCKVIETEIPAGVNLERSSGGAQSVTAAADLLSKAKFPVILNGAGVILSEGGIETSRKLAEQLAAPVCCNYQHNDAFPGNHALYVGPLGYNGSKAAMELIKKADVVLALGTRLNPFSTLPAYSMEYWPKDTKLIQVDINADRIGLTKPVTIGIQGDAKLVAEGIIEKLSPEAGSVDRTSREEAIQAAKSSWTDELASMLHEEDDIGTSWNERSRKRHVERMSPRMAWQAIQRVLPSDAIISTDIGNNCAIGNAYPSFESGRKYLAPGLFGPCGYGFPAILGAKVGQPNVPVVGFAGDGAFGISMNELTACGRNQWPAVTMVVFRNYQWGAEKRNTTLWYKDNFVGTELNYGVEYAEVAKACGLKGVKVETAAALEEALKNAVEGQMKRKETTLIEVVLNQELGEPFRRDAMTAPVHIAGISKEDMRS
jgi:sulfoacetaldehyde acetyltransferase